MKKSESVFLGNESLLTCFFLFCLALRGLPCFVVSFFNDRWRSLVTYVAREMNYSFVFFGVGIHGGIEVEEREKVGEKLLNWGRIGHTDCDHRGMAGAMGRSQQSPCDKMTSEGSSKFAFPTLMKSSSSTLIKSSHESLTNSVKPVSVEPSQGNKGSVYARGKGVMERPAVSPEKPPARVRSEQWRATTGTDEKPSSAGGSQTNPCTLHGWGIYSTYLHYQCLTCF